MIDSGKATSRSKICSMPRGVEVVGAREVGVLSGCALFDLSAVLAICKESQ